RTLEARATYVLHLERGEWKVVQVHWSFPQANVETLGRSVTVTIDELEKMSSASSRTSRRRPTPMGLWASTACTGSLRSISRTRGREPENPPSVTERGFVAPFLGGPL